MAITAPVPTSTIAANTPAETSSGRYHASVRGRPAAASGSGAKSTTGRAALTPAMESSDIGAISGTSSTSDQAIARIVADCTGDATDVIWSSSGRRVDSSAAPAAAVSSGREVVMTGTRISVDSAVVTAGMVAPPPMEAIAERSAG